MSETTAIPATLKASKPAKKATPKAKAHEGNGKGGPCKPQQRILLALAKGPLPKAKLAKASKVNPNWIAEYVGSPDTEPRVRQSGVLRGLKLVPMGLVRLAEVDVDGRRENLYELTAKGKAAAAKLKG